jgi:DNA modification methylase
VTVDEKQTAGPKLFYRGPLATLYHGDSREILPALRDRADLIVTDPPYGMAYESGQRRKDEFGPIAGDDGNLDVAAIIRQALKRLRNGRHLYVFGPNVLEGLDVADPSQLIWDKHLFGSGDLEQPWGPSWEPIWFSAYIPSAANRDRRRGQPQRPDAPRQRHPLPRPISRAVNRHPTEKPVELLRQLIESSSASARSCSTRSPAAAPRSSPPRSKDAARSASSSRSATAKSPPNGCSAPRPSTAAW